jgi:FkbM family methyltransferase
MLALLHPRAAYLRITESLDLRLCARLESLRRSGRFQGVTHVLDAGANEGAYGSACARIIPDVEIICFEPVPSTYDVMVLNTRRYPKIKPVNLALGSSLTELPMHVGEFHPANSLLKMTEKHLENWPGTAPSKVVKVPVVPLDYYLEAEGIKGDFFLKADVQGYEIELLKGAKQSLARCRILQIEVSIVSLYEGTPTLADIWNYITSAGFALLDVVDILKSPHDGTAVSCDLVFVRV